ncbi:uncharacterized protein LOC131302835 [Rhododendron vialii]|uniref:uncharacterized protein LOC131302835 n=1 Tax=Rhododendron vialii TaxID=182163 RepID=UPI00265E148C|nr:uncharacterized protein LOC131302835 [Rhododendron vialii]
MKNLVRSHTKIKVSYVNWERKPEFVRYDRLLKLFNEAVDNAMYSIAKTDRMATRLQEIKAENDLYDEECQTNTPTVGDVQNDLESFKDKSNTVGDPSVGPRRGRPLTKRKQSMTKQIVRKNTKSNKRVQCSRANAKSTPDVEVHTHATGFHEIVMQESGNVTVSITSFVLHLITRMGYVIAIHKSHFDTRTSERSFSLREKRKQKKISRYLSSACSCSQNFGIGILNLEQMGLARESRFHVLSVNDSIIDRKLIESLLKTSSCHGN